MSALKNLSSVAIGVVFVVFALSLASAQNDFEFPPRDFEQLDEIQQLLQKVQALYAEKIAPKTLLGEVPDEDLREIDLKAGGETGSPHGAITCKCARLACTCCKRICIGKLGINNNYCVSLTYVPSAWSIKIVIKADYQIILSSQISVNKPHAVCAPIRCRMAGVKICLEFRNVVVAKGNVRGCSKITVYCPAGIVGIFDLGCFHVHCLNAAQQWSQMMGPQPVEIDGIPMEELTPSG